MGDIGVTVDDVPKFLLNLNDEKATGPDEGDGSCIYTSTRQNHRPALGIRLAGLLHH